MGESSSSACEESAPDWLLSDPRLKEAVLEGENRALRKAVERTQAENKKLIESQQATKARNRVLESQNRAAADALGKVEPSARTSRQASVSPSPTWSRAPSPRPALFGRD